MATLAEYLLDYEKSTLAWPPHPDTTCSLLEHDVGRAFIKSFLCQAVKSIEGPYSSVLLHQCALPKAQFNCTTFLTDVFSWNLTNQVFAISSSRYSTDALMNRAALPPGGGSAGRRPAPTSAW